jgi:hypothetical protein
LPDHRVLTGAGPAPKVRGHKREDALNNDQERREAFRNLVIRSVIGAVLSFAVVAAYILFIKN